MDFKTSIKLLFFTCVFAGGWLYCTAAGNKPDEPTRALWNAVYTNDSDGVRAALDKGANVEMVDFFGYTPIFLPSMTGHLDVTDMLIKAKANLEYEGPYGKRLMHLAAFVGQDELIRRLVKAGADINALSRDGKTPLQMAVSRNRTSTAELLRSLGARQ